MITFDPNDTEADGLVNPHAAGQQAAQSVGIKPIAQQPMPDLTVANAGNANRGIMPTNPAPAAPSYPKADEPTFNANDTPPAEAAPEAASAYRNAGSGWGTDQEAAADQKNIDLIKAGQQAILSAKLGAVQQALGGANFNPSTGDSSVWQRARMGMMASPQDREQYLKDNMPGADVKTINVQGVGPMVVFKPPGSDTYQPIKGTEDVAGKFGDALSAVPSVGGQVATAVATDGESLLARLVAQAVSGFGERGTELGVNKAQGYDRQPISSDAADAAGSGATAAAAEMGASALSNLVGKGGGVFAPTDVGAERMAATKALQNYDPNLKDLTAFQLGHPLLEAKGNRLAAVNPTLGNIAGQQGSTLADLISKSMADATGGGAPALGDSSVQAGNVLYPGLADVVEKMKTDAAAPLSAIPTVTPTAGGQAFQQGANELKDKLAGRTASKFDAAFNSARNAPDAPNGVVPFDLTQPQSVAAEMSRGLRGQGVPKEVENEVPVMGQGGLGEPVQIGSQTEKSVEPTEVPIGGIMPSIAKMVENLRALNPQNGVGPMTENTDAPYDVLKTLRTQLSHAAEYPGASAAPDAKAASYQARQIIKPLDESLLNPGEGAPADFVPKMQAAQNASKFQGKVLDNPDMQTAMHTSYPEDVMSLADPSNATFLKMAQRTMNPDRYQKFQDAYATAAIREPEKMSALMDSYRKDPTVLDRLISPQNQDLLKQYGIDMDNVGKSLPNKLLSTTDYNARARQAFDGASGNDLTDLITRGGGQDSPIGKNLRGALFQNVLDNSMNNEGKLEMGKAMKAVSDVLSDGRAKAVLNPDELKRLEDIRSYAAGGDSLSKGLGSSIYGSEVAGGALTPTNILLAPRQFLRALGELAEARVQNATWTSKAGTKFVFGQPGGSPPILPRAVGTGAAAYEKNQNRQEPTVGQ